MKDLLGVLRWADNPRNALAAFRTVQLLPGMGPVNARRVLEHLQRAGGALGALTTFTPPPAAAEHWAQLLALLLELADPCCPWSGQVQRVRRWYQPHLERIYEQVHTRNGDLEQLEVLSGQYPSRERFLSELALDPPSAASDLAGPPALDEDYLVLSTVHSAKGMEWDTVYLLNVVDGSFPSEYAAGSTEQLEEERRLFYVALTRARNDLLLYAPLKFYLTGQHRHGDAHVYGGRSRFLTAGVLTHLDSDTPAALIGGTAEGTTAGFGPALDVGARLRQMW